MKKTNVRKREMSEDELRNKDTKILTIGAIGMLVMVAVYLGIVAYVMVKFSGYDIPGLIIAGISIMSISAYLFSLFESIKDIELKNDFKNSNTMALGIFRGVKYAFAVAFAAYAFVFQYFDLPLLVR